MVEIIFKILYSFAVSFLLIICLDKISLNSIKKYYWSSNIVIGIIISLFVYYDKIEICAVFTFVLLCLLGYVNSRQKLYSVFISLIVILVCFLSYFICSFVIDILTPDQKQVVELLSYEFTFTMISFFFLSIFFSVVINKIFMILEIDYRIFESQSINKIFAVLVFVIVLITGIIDGCIFVFFRGVSNITLILTFRNVGRLVILLNLLFIFLFLAFNVILIYTNNKNYERKMKKQFRINEIKRLKEYTGMIEDISDDLRRFRHDYFNIMEIIKVYIENENIQGLKEFYNEELVPESDKLKKKNKSILMIKNLKIDSLKGLISSKIVKAQAMQINTHVEIIDEINKINMSEIDICRIIGIFLDNAIEEAQNIKNSFINVYIIKKKESVIIVINNSCRKVIPPVYKIFEKGFSTKGQNRGLGLSNVKKIIDEKYDNVYLSTKIKDKVFTQEVIINSESGIDN